MSHISSTHTSHSVTQLQCLPTMRRVLGSSLWYKPGVAAHDCTGKRGFRFMPCLKHSPLDDLYKWRLNMCEQIFLPKCTALGKPLASGSNCTAQDGATPSAFLFCPRQYCLLKAVDRLVNGESQGGEGGGAIGPGFLQFKNWVACCLHWGLGGDREIPTGSHGRIPFLVTQ